MMGMMDKMLEIIGAKTKHISKVELEELKKEFGEEVGNKIYEIAGKGSRLSKAEMVRVAELFEAMVVPKVEEKVEKEVGALDMRQNERLLWLEKQVGQIRTSELGYLGQRLHMLREDIRSLERDVVSAVERLNKVSLKGEEI